MRWGWGEDKVIKMGYKNSWLKKGEKYFDSFVDYKLKGRSRYKLEKWEIAKYMGMEIV